MLKQAVDDYLRWLVFKEHANQVGIVKYLKAISEQILVRGNERRQILEMMMDRICNPEWTALW